MVIFGDEDNMVERFVEIDARVFLEGTAHVASGFCWKTQKTRVFAAISLRSKVLKVAPPPFPSWGYWASPGKFCSEEKPQNGPI